MSNEPFDALENWFSHSGIAGGLDNRMTGGDLDAILNRLPPVPLSNGFHPHTVDTVNAARPQYENAVLLVDLGLMLSGARTRAHLELGQLAAQVRVSQAALREIETGSVTLKQLVRRLPPTKARRLLRIIGLDIQEFIAQLMDLALARTMIYSTARTGILAGANPEESELLADYIAQLERSRRA